MSYRNIINIIATALLSLALAGTWVSGIDVPESDGPRAVKPKPTPLEIASFWTPERQRSVVSRDVTIDIGTGVIFVRQADGLMAPVNVHAPLSTGSPSSEQPTKNPSATPSLKPTSSPAEGPTGSPTRSPSKSPTKDPTGSPSSSPSDHPTKNPSTSPVSSPPTLNPTVSPTMSPTPNITFGNDSSSSVASLSALKWSFNTADESYNDGDRKLQAIVADSDVESPTPPKLQAVGRLLFCFGNNCFLCSATVISGNMITTAAHCAYNLGLGGVFAENVMFIPNQDDGGTDGSDFDCTNDLYGCWFPDHAVISRGYADAASGALSLEYDFATLVIKTGSGSGSHLSVDGLDDRPLDDFVCPFSLDFDREEFVNSLEFGTAYGYPGASFDPGFRFCQGPVDEIELLPIIGTDITTVWMEDCTMTGGSSGGAWVPYQTVDIYSVVSYSLTSGGESLPGRGGPRCYIDGRCQCVLDAAQTSTGNFLVDDVSCQLDRVESSGPACLSSALPTTSPTMKPTNIPTLQPTNKPTTVTSPPTSTSSPTKNPGGGSRSSGSTSSSGSSSSKSSKSMKSKKKCSDIRKERKCRNYCEWDEDDESCTERINYCEDFLTKKKCNKNYPTCEWDLDNGICADSVTTQVSADTIEAMSLMTEITTIDVSPLTERVGGVDDGLVARIRTSGCNTAKASAIFGAIFTIPLLMM